MTPRIPLPPPLDTTPFTAARAIDAGLKRGRLRGTDLQRPFRGVRVAAQGTLALVRLCQTLQAKLPPHAYFSGITAAAIMAVPLPYRHERSRILHIGVHAPHRAPVGRGVRGHTFDTSAGDVRLWHGLRIISPELAWCELATVLSVPELVAAGDFLIHWRLPITNAASLADAVGRFAGRRGVRKLRVALALLSDRSESPRESMLRVIVLQAMIPGLEVNLRITTTGGYRYRGDLAFRKEKVIIEYQSEFHRSPERFRADMTRISRLEADEWFVIQVNNDDLNNPAELVARIRRVLASR